MKITPLQALKDNYIWMLVDDNNKLAVCVDPGEAKPVIDFLQKHDLSLTSILLTHHHFDHINGVGELLDIAPDIPVYAPDDSRIALRNVSVSDNDQVSVLGYTFDVISIPGHTSSHLCYYEARSHLLFCGDTLFSAGCGRVFDGTMEQLYQSIQRLRNLPDVTQVYCAHEYTRQNLRFALFIEPENAQAKQYLQQLNLDSYACSLPSTIGFEKQINPFFRTNEPSLINSLTNLTEKKPDSFSIFSYLREEKNRFS